MKGVNKHIKVKVEVGKKKEKVVRTAHDTFRIEVEEKAEAGKANRRILEILKSEFGQDKHIKLISGARTPSKIYLIE